jgi:hypothetical protein
MTKRLPIASASRPEEFSIEVKVGQAKLFFGSCSDLSQRLPELTCPIGRGSRSENKPKTAAHALPRVDRDKEDGHANRSIPSHF